MKKLFSILLAVILSTSFTYNAAFATQDNNRVKGDEPAKTEQKQESDNETKNDRNEEKAKPEQLVRVLLFWWA